MPNLIKVLITLLAFNIVGVLGISKYDFNVCRIQNCVSRQKNCIAEESQCLKGFSQTRNCFQTCNSADQINDYNICWSKCRNSIFATNIQYQQIAKCYEQICYLSAFRLKILVSLCILSLLALVF